MTEAVRIVLENERPKSWNTFWAGEHWTTRKDEKDRVAWLVRSEIDPEAATVFDAPVEIEVIAYYDSRPADSDNVCDKPYIDALIGWYIEDDSPEYVDAAITRSRLDTDNPRVEIIIRESCRTPMV